MVTALLHALVDVFSARETFAPHNERLVDHRAENAVHDKARAVLYRDRMLTDLLCERFGGGVRRVVGLNAANKLDQAHHRNGIEKMQTDKTLGSTDGSG